MPLLSRVNRARIRLVAFAPLLLGACRAEAPRDAGLRSTFAVDTGRVAVDGGSLYWEATGTGAPVILIHGGNLDRRMWDAQFDTLRNHYRVIRYDARGFGRSSRADRPFRAPEDLAALLHASVDTSNPATDRHRKTGHHAGELRLVIGMR
jgi:alpha-beta hydrolase superfamily lysophospholipase